MVFWGVHGNSHKLYSELLLAGSFRVDIQWAYSLDALSFGSIWYSHVLPIQALLNGRLASGIRLGLICGAFRAGMKGFHHSLLMIQDS